jgi:hypothetical protein
MAGNWSEDNFGNDGARATLELWTAKMVATITEVLADRERIAPDEDGESMLMPSVEMLALLCERYNAAPPKAVPVRQWHEKYLAAFDKGAGSLKLKADQKAHRRKVIENTFRWLEGLAEAYHED